MPSPLPFYVRDTDPPAKREILRAAVELFGRRGLAGTSIRDIARASGFTNPALYKHFASKEALALHLFEVCHARVWQECADALETGTQFAGQLDAYVERWLRFMDDQPEVIAFLSDSARELWPLASASVQRNTMIGLARTLARAGLPPRSDRRRIDVVAAGIQGTLAELARMLQLGVAKGPAAHWKAALVASLARLIR